MSELEILVRAYVDLNRINSEPGAQSHMCADSIHRILRLIKEVLKK